MSDFLAKITAQLDMAQAEGKMNAFLKDRKVKVDVDLNTGNININNLISQIKSQFQSVGQSAGTNLANSINSSLGKINVQNTATQIANLKRTLGSMNFNTTSIDTITKNLQSLDLEVTKVTTKMNGKNLNVRVDGIDQMGRAVSVLQEFDSATGKVRQASQTVAQSVKQMFTDADASKLSASIATLDSNFVKLKGSVSQESTALAKLKTDLAGIKNIKGLENQQKEFERITQEVNRLSTACKKAKAEAASAAATQQLLTGKTVLGNQIETWMNRNTKAAKVYGTQLQVLQTQLQAVQNGTQLSVISNQFKEIQSAAAASGNLGNSVISQLIGNVTKLSPLFGMSYMMSTGIRSIKNAVNSVYNLDTALVDLKKTTTMNNTDLESFYSNANGIAKEMGVSTEEIINQASAWSRLGYSSKDAAESMAKLSSQFAAISPGMDVDTATDGLVSIMKAYDVDVDDVLDGVMSKINIIGNTAATSNADIVNMLTRSSSAMAEANNSLEETIALETAAVEITQDPDSVGTAFKTISMRIRGYDEETESYTNDVEVLNGKIADLTKTASTPGGISLFTDETKTEYKSTYQLLEEISEIYDELTDKQQAQLLETLAGKRQGQIVAATIKNFDAARKAMDNMTHSAGDADKEMNTIKESLEYKVNALKETGVGIAQNLFQRDDMKSFVDGLTSVLEVVDKLTEKLGLFKTVAISGGLIAGIKSIVSAIKGIEGAKTFNSIMYALGDVKWISNISKAASAFKEIPIALSTAFRNMGTALTFGAQPLEALSIGLSSLSGTILPLVAATAGISALAVALHAVFTAGDRANERMESSVEAYSNAKNDLESVNQELEETQSKMDALTSKGGLTFVEQGQLEDLRAATEELRVQQKLKEKEVERTAKQAAKDSYNAYEKNYAGYGKVNDDAVTKAKEVAAMFANDNEEYYLGDEKDIPQLIAGLKEYRQESQKAFNENKTDAKEYYDEMASEAEDSIMTQIGKLQEYKANLEEIPVGQRTVSENKALKDITDTIEYAWKQVDENEWNQLQFDKIFDDSDMSKAKLELVDLAKATNNVGITVDDVKNKYPELASAVEASGFKVEDLVNQINSEAGVMNLDEIRNQLKDIEDIEIDGDYSKKIKDDWDSFIDGLSNDEIEIMYSIKNSQDTDGWSVDQWKQAIYDAQNDVQSSVDDTTNAIDALTQSTSTTIAGIQKATSVLTSQSTGKSISIDDFNSDELKDYTSALEYNNGVLQLNAEKVQELQKAKAEEAIQTNENQKLEKQSQYMENIAQIEQLQDKLRGLSDAKSTEAQSIQNSINALLSDNDAIVSQCNQLDLLSASLREATGAYQNWLNKQNGSESGDMFDDAMGALSHIKDVTQNTESDDYGRIGKESYKAAVEFLIPDKIDSQDAEAVSSYIDSIEHYFNHDSEGNRTGLDVAEFCAKATKAGLMELDEASGDYKVAGQRTMEDFAEGLNLSLPMVQAMFGEMEEFGAEFDWADESIKTLGDLGMAAGEAKGRIEELEGNEDLNIQIDVSDIDSTEDKISTLKNTISEMQNYKSTLDVDSSQVDDANAVIQYCVAQKQMLEAPAVMSVDASQVDGELGNALSLLQQFKDATNNVEAQAAVGADTSEAQGQVDSLVSEINGLSPEIKATLGINGESEATITASIEALTPKMMVEAGVDSSLVDAYAAEEKKSKGTVNWDNETGKVDSWAAQMHTSNGTVNWTNNTTNVKTSFTATGHVNWINANAPSKGSGGANGTAHADGTAHLPHLVGHANAQGNWGTKTGGLTLVGELGREIVVDPGSGTWHTVGDNGAEFTYIPAGSIVFNHLQSESLLERGFVNSRAKGMSNVTGTAMVTGHIPIKQANIASGNTTYKGSSGSSSSGSSSSGSSSGGSTAAYRANTNSVNANTSATDSNTKSAKESKSTIDFVKIKLDRLANTFEYAANQITDYVSSAFKTAVLKKQMKIIDKQLTANQEAYDTYMKKANSVGLSEEYKKLVKNGALKIEDIDTSTDSGKKLSENIKDFQSYYESAIECKNTIQELNNKLLELYDTLANMPIEKAEKAIDKLKSKYESLDNVYGAISGGGSTFGHLQDQIKKDNPTLANAQKNLDKATTARNKTKSTRSKASKNLKSATTDVGKTGTNLINANKKQTSSIAKKLKKAAKSTTDNATYNTIARAIREGKSISTKGLKGDALKYAKSYNKSLKQGNTIASKVKAGKTVSTSGMTSTLKAKAKKYNTDAKEKNEAQKEYDKAKKADEKALKKLNAAKDTKNKAYSGSTKEQQILATTNGKKAYVYQNMLLTQETRNLKEQNKQRQSALKQVNKNYNNALKNSNSANASKKSAQKKLLSDKSVTSKLTKAQKAALEAGKKVSTSGISDPKVLKKIEAYNKKVANATDLNKKLKIQEDALADATKEAANAEAEYAQSIVENAKKKLDNIAAYYDSFMSQWENRSSMIETYMDRMQTQGYNLSTKFYEAQIQQEQSIVDNLSEKYKAMKRNFEAAVQNGDITKGTQEYYEMKDSVDQVSNSLAEAENKVFELQASIRDLKWEQFDQLQDSISRITSESDFMIDLMSHKDMFDDDGKMTEQGLATLGLHGVNYNTYMAQADKYKEEMLRISEELAKDPYNQKLIDRKNELVDAQQKSILSAENEKDAMKDLIKDGIENELDSLQDLIDKYLDAIQAQKDLYDYQKKIREKTEEIASLQKQLASLQGDNSEENKAKLQELKNSLKDAQEDLEDTQYEKFISDQKELLDNLKNEYEEILNKRLDNIDGLLSDMISEINSNASQISDTLRTEAASVGYDLSTEMQNVWNATNDVNGVIAAYDSNFSSTMTGVSSAIDDIYKRQQEMINAIDSMAGKLVQKVQEETADPVVGELEEVKQKPNKNNVAEGNPTPDPPKVSDKDSIKDAVLVDPDEPKKKPKKKPNKTNGTKAGNGKAEVGDNVTYTSGVYHAASDGTGATGSYYLGKKVKITRINKGSKYPYCIDAADGTQLGWVKLSQLKGYASGSKSIPSDQYGWTQELGTESLIRKRDGAIVTPFERGDMVLDADATKNLWDMMNDPSGFINGTIDDGLSSPISSMGVGSNTVNNFDNITFDLPNVADSKQFMNEMINNRKFEQLIRTMTVDRMSGKSSVSKYKFRK